MTKLRQRKSRGSDLMYFVANIPQIQSIFLFNLTLPNPKLTACVLPVFVLTQAWFITSTYFLS